MRAAVFDFDGVIMDSEPAHFRALRDALAEEGILIDEVEYEAHLLAYDDRTSIRLALERRGRACSGDVLEKLALRKAASFEEARKHITTFPGVREFVEAFSPTIPLAIASGALHREVESLLEAASLHVHFPVIVAADDVSQSKPHPEPYLKAVRQLAALVPDLAPGQCLAFEDTVAGIAAARGAGLRVVGITNTYPAPKLDLAHRVVPSLVGLRPADFFSLFET